MNETAVIKGNTVNLNLTSSGHYCTSIDQNKSIPVEIPCAVNLQETGDKKQHGTWLLKDAEIWRDAFEQTISDIEQNMKCAKQYAKTTPNQFCLHV